MIQIDPLASKKMDRNGRYAIHWAVDAHGSSSKVVRLLLSNHPESCCKREGRFGFLPIHIACFYPSEYSLKQQQQQQQSLEHTGKDTMIHSTNSDNYVEDESNICCSSTTSGNQPNQQFCSNYYYSAEEEQDAFAIVQSLLQTYPEGAAVTDNYGWIPLHILCRTNRRGADIVQLLLTVYPQGELLNCV
jgi:ankyrin repeat protein